MLPTLDGRRFDGLNMSPTHVGERFDGLKNDFAMRRTVGANDYSPVQCRRMKI